MELFKKKTKRDKDKDKDKLNKNIVNEMIIIYKIEGKYSIKIFGEIL